MYYVYFIKSLKNGKIYVGLTNKDPKTRLKEHNSGSSEFTRNNRPFTPVYYENYICKEDAAKREKFYKSGIGKKIKKAIINAMLQ